MKRLLIIIIAALSVLGMSAQTHKDRVELGIALDYFQSGKYHEALNILARLDSVYRLNPRISAYTGLCYYYEDDFKHAAATLDKAMPKLEAFSPDERAVYYKAAADSHFILLQYDKALSAYESMLAICRETEKAEAFYRVGFIYVYKEQWKDALDNLQSALVYYRIYQPDATARIAQIRNMIVGCCDKIK